VSEPAAPRSTVAIVGREAYSPTPATVGRVLERSGPSPRVVVIDGGSPKRISRQLARLAAECDLTLVRHDAVLGANEARNLALDHVTTEFVAFLDNDTLVEDGWLEGLERCARETGAVAVSPVVLWGPSARETIHFAGGECRIVTEPGGRRLLSHNAFMHQPADTVATLSRRSSELIELHCALVRTDALRTLGRFEERYIAGREEAEFSLVTAERGCTIMVEPAVVVGYPSPKRLEWTDLRYFAARWSDRWARRSFRVFNAKWSIDDPSTDDTFLEGHRVRRIGPWPGWDGPDGRRAGLAWKARRAIDVVATPLAARAEDRRRTRAGATTVVHRASWDIGPPGREADTLAVVPDAT